MKESINEEVDETGNPLKMSGLGGSRSFLGDRIFTKPAQLIRIDPCWLYCPDTRGSHFLDFSRLEEADVAQSRQSIKPDVISVDRH